MERTSRWLAGIVIGLLLAVLLPDATPGRGNGFAAAQAQGVADEATLRREVNAFMEQYWALFSAGQIDQLAERVYHPFGQLNNTGHSSIEQMKARFPDTRKKMLAGGYGKSDMPKRSICILSPTVALISGRGVRYLTDGRVMAEFGWTYTLLKGATGWRMVSIYSHDPGTVVTC
jgi:hypothetical protein